MIETLRTIDFGQCWVHSIIRHPHFVKPRGSASDLKQLSSCCVPEKERYLESPPLFQKKVGDWNPPAKEYVCRERPGCRISFDRDRLWIDVEGTSGVVEVRRYTGKRWAGPGAY